LVIDSSAVISILKREEGWRALFEAILNAEFRVMSVFTLLEAEIVWYGRTRSTEAVRELRKLLLEDLKVLIVPFDERFPPIASRIFQSYGKRIAPPRPEYRRLCGRFPRRPFECPCSQHLRRFVRAGLKSGR